MRKYLIPLMAASMLVPVAATAADRDSSRADRQSERSERSERARAERPQRNERSVERAERQERRQQARSDRSDRRIERSQQVQLDRAERLERTGRTDRRAPVQRVDRVPQPDRVQPVDQVRQVQQVDRDRRIRGDAGLLTGLREAARQDGDRRDHDWRDRDHDRDWSRDWRRDRRYDWHNYRNRYGSLFRLGRYYDPYGWGYRRFSIGFSLWPSYYGSSFWLNDPWQYRLPPAYGPYRWVRYYNDALLVNIYSGQVVDVIYNVFW